VKRLDVFLRDWRIARAIRFIRPGSRVLDIGCHDGALFRAIGPGLRQGIGVDPALAGPLESTKYSLRPGAFPDAAPDEECGFDAVCALAVLEHVDANSREPFAAAVARLLVPGGQAILTVPSPVVDRIIDVMIRLGIIDGMEAEQHHGFDVDEVVPLFTGAGLWLQRSERFQFGLNHCFIFVKPER
jgi:SAM-dependent methyltransferase